MDPIIGASLIGAGTSLLGGMFSSLSSSQTNEANMQIARENRDWQEKMWNMQNEYNSPENQLSLYRQAGFNPLTALERMSGNSSAGSVGTPSLPVMNPTDYGFLSDAGQKVMDGLVAKAQVDNLNADTANKTINNKSQAKRNELELNNLRQQNDKIKAEVDKLYQDYLNAIKTGRNLDTQHSNLIKEGENIEANTKATIEGNQRAKDLQPKIIEQIDTEIANLKQQTSLMPYEAKTRRISANANVMSARAQQQQVENTRRSIELEIRKWNVQEQVVLPYELQERLSRIGTAMAENRKADAMAEYQEMLNQVERDKPEWYKAYLGPNGMVTEVLHTACEVAGTAASVYMSAKLGKASSVNAASNRMNAETNRMNAEKPSPLGTYTNSYGVNSTWNP